MKTIHIVRHSKAVSQELGISDFERKLEKRGSKDAKQVAARLKKKSGKPQLIVTSSAARALETARQFASELSLKKKDIIKEPELYEADSKRVLELVNNFPDDKDSIMIVGHNPAFEDFAHHIIHGFTNVLPTSAVVSAEIPADSWKQVKGGSGRLVAFDHPSRKKELNEEAKVLRKELREELTASLLNLLKKKNADVVLRLEAPVVKRAAEIAKRFVHELTSQGLPLKMAPKSQRTAGSTTRVPGKPAMRQSKRTTSPVSKGQPVRKRTVKKPSQPKKDDKV